jgi:hypothetical protein
VPKKFTKKEVKKAMRTLALWRWSRLTKTEKTEFGRERVMKRWNKTKGKKVKK